ncbi:MerR family transcriptional regulator [Kroppenstedtia eburnea]|uniref:DNA-binding transcriptional regulator, MerR family n=1 Tax=Kroppenstedtia eburnea TaxID=714067 RepID=A0A1N7MCI5_9BACL|nr:MerR family transcriptional regulator [Kroppenstedtia eburnea]QKI81489.1 MerR family transcriptional regulator [Kroppenstedtia eburnea]SIS83772.1 DNA-binding transcriptional regulator, MerR family [Kroppenstedtia eburnea]
MLYTVKEISHLANVTIKTLHHYHKIGLLLPCKVSEAGYRLYGMKELERLQEILLYRELDFSLDKIKEILDGEPDRLSILSEQRKLILTRKDRLEQLIQTIDDSIEHAQKGEITDKSKMFRGFESEAGWKEALSEQNEYLKETYGYDLLEENPIDVQSMNKSAMEAKRFTDGMAKALKDGLRFDDEKVQHLIYQHLNFLNNHGHETTTADFAKQTRFFLNDDFHRNMLEGQQAGLSYYLCIAAETFASDEKR